MLFLFNNSRLAKSCRTHAQEHSQRFCRLATQGQVRSPHRRFQSCSFVLYSGIKIEIFRRLIWIDLISFTLKLWHLLFKVCNENILLYQKKWIWVWIWILMRVTNFKSSRCGMRKNGPTEMVWKLFTSLCSCCLANQKWQLCAAMMSWVVSSLGCLPTDSGLLDTWISRELE